jgi:hypothetical protein
MGEMTGKNREVEENELETEISIVFWGYEMDP